MVSHLLESIPPEAVYLIVGVMIMVESLGIPVPGEIALVTAAVLATQHKGLVPAWIAVAASAGAIAGDSIGFYVGHRVGSPLFDWLGRKFPRHFGPSHVVVAERFFTRHGAWAVFFGRFIALLRIFSGPLAGSLHMPYGRFLLANATGGIIWATGITYLIWFLGQAAEKWLSRASWIGLVAALAVGLAVTLLIRRRTSKLAAQHQAESAAEHEAESPANAESPAEAESPTEAEASAEASAPAGEAPAGEAPSRAQEAEAGLAAGHGQARPSAASGEARLPTGNGKAPSARQRTESDR
ncbi:MAG TPA: DedA family protein [Streptosporangiaceae bacterium]|nr:DedA family protein [Streptosporangiaceae bacterium]